MEVRSTREEVGTRQSHIREAGAIRPATDGRDAGRDSSTEHSGLSALDILLVGCHLFVHIIVGVADLDLDDLALVSGIDLACDTLHQRLLLLEERTIMIADDVLGFGMLYPTGEVHQVIEALIPLGELRARVVRE